MFRKLFFGLIVLLLVPAAFGIGLGIPSQSDFLFVPNGELVVEFSVNNGLDRELPVTAILDIPAALEGHVTMSEEVTTVPAKGSKSLKMLINLPDEIPYGLHKIFYSVTEAAKVKGSFVAHVGITHEIKILRQHPKGTPEFKLRGPNKFPGTGAANVDVEIQNIGQTDIKDRRVRVYLERGDEIYEQYSDRITVAPLETTNVFMEFPVEGIPLGLYSIVFEMGDTSHKWDMQVGEPQIELKKFETFETGNWQLVGTINNLWSDVLVEGAMSAKIKDPDTGKVLAEAHSLTVELQPGENNVGLRLNKNEFPEGTYPVDIQYITTPYFASAIGEVEVTKGAYAQAVEQAVKAEDKEGQGGWTTQLVPIDQDTKEKVDKSRPAMMIGMLVLIAIFLFALAMLFRRKKNDTETTNQP